MSTYEIWTKGAGTNVGIFISRMGQRGHTSNLIGTNQKPWTKAYKQLLIYTC